MLSVADALAAILQQALPLPAMSVPLSELPLGQVLAEAVAGDIDSPPYTKAMMDGYAVRAADCSTTPVALKVIEEIAAGKTPTKTIQAGEAARIMTGAPIPDGADAVVMIERTETVSPAEVRIFSSPNLGQHILERGSEMKAGDVILRPGDILGPQELGLLAAVGRTAVAVHPRPRVAVLPTGDEIVEPPAKPGQSQIRNSNGPMLLAQIARAGGAPRYLGIARDTADSLRTLISQGLKDADILVLSGGVSAGKFDLVPGILEELGVVNHFHKVVMKPGKPLFFGTLDSKLIFGLPGNPVSSFVCFELFIRPALRKLLGYAEPNLQQFKAPIAEEFRADNERPTFWPARLEVRDALLQVSALPWFGSADLRALYAANALIVLPPGLQEYAPGQVVQVMSLVIS